VGLHGKNLTDKHYKVAGYNFLDFDLATGAIRQPPKPGAGLGLEGVLSAFYGAPRQVFLSFGYKF
jgi:iron complex outermembrane receptor protein